MWGDILDVTLVLHLELLLSFLSHLYLSRLLLHPVICDRVCWQLRVVSDEYRVISESRWCEFALTPDVVCRSFFAGC